MALQQDASSPSKMCMLVVEKEASTLSTLHGIANCVKNGTTRKIVNDVSVSQQCYPQLLSVKFENLVHSIFRNENSTLEINVSHFGVVHWQQWQPPASAPDFINIVIFYILHGLVLSETLRFSSLCFLHLSVYKEFAIDCFFYIFISNDFFKLHMVFICKQKNLELFIHSYSNTLGSRTYYSKRLYQFSPV